MLPTSVRATVVCLPRSLCVTEWGNPPSSQLSSFYGDVDDDIQGSGRVGEGGENQRG